MKTMILGVFKSVLDAENAVIGLEKYGYEPKDISVIMQDHEEAKKLMKNTGTKVGQGATSGATTGTLVGGLTGLLIGLGIITIPGLGALLIGGPLAAGLGLTAPAAATLSGAVSGALAGGLIGSLVALGLSEEDAHYYEDSIKKGSVFVAVPLDERDEGEIKDILGKYNVDRLKTVDVTLN